MTTNRTIDELMNIFRDGQLDKSVTSDQFRDLIVSLHPASGLFADLPGSPGNLAAGRLWQSDGVVKMSLGGGPAASNALFVGAGAGRFTAAPRQRMLGKAQHQGRGSFAASATVASVPSAPTTFSDDFNSFSTNNWYADSYDDGGDAFWTNDPSLTSQIMTFSNGRMHLALMQTPGGFGISKPYISCIIDTWNPGWGIGTRFEQQYGYFEVAVAVDRFSGLEYEFQMFSAYNWLPAFAVRIYTDGSNVQHALMALYGAPISLDTNSDAGWNASTSHTYGIEWTATAVRFYRDRQLVGDYGNPGGPYTGGDPCSLVQYCQSNYAAFDEGPVLDPGSLPKYAHVDSVKVWASRPF